MTLILTYSRTLWLALPLGTLLWALRFLSRKQAAAAVAAAALAAVVVMQLPSVRSRTATDLGVGAREQLWLANLEFLRERPLTGTGFRLNQAASYYYLESLPGHGEVFGGHAHDNFLECSGARARSAPARGSGGAGAC